HAAPWLSVRNVGQEDQVRRNRRSISRELAMLASPVDPGETLEGCGRIRDHRQLFRIKRCTLWLADVPLWSRLGMLAAELGVKLGCPRLLAISPLYRGGETRRLFPEPPLPFFVFDPAQYRSH